MKKLLERIRENLSKSKLDLSIFISCVIVTILCIVLLVILFNRDGDLDNEVEVRETVTATDAQRTENNPETKMPEETIKETETGSQTLKEPKKLKADIAMSGEWGGEGEQFMQFDLNLTNVSKSTIPDWKLIITFTEDVTISQGWGGEFTSQGKEITILPADYTKEIPAGELRNLGMILTAADYAYAEKYQVVIGDFEETIPLIYEEKMTQGQPPVPTEQPAETAIETEIETEEETKQQADSQTYQNTSQENSDSGNITSASVTGYYSEHGALTVNGTKIYDSHGVPFRLKGVSTHGLSWFPEYVNKEAFASLKEYGVNTIRLAMYTSEYNGYCSGGDQNQLKNIVKNGVQYATELGMYAIIDWHILSDGNPNTYKNEAIAFFDEMSKQYAAQSNVLYEICNEPNGGVAWSEIKAYAEQVIPVIRANDPDAIIIVGTPTWSQDVDAAANDPITGYDNIVYALHFYAATHKDNIQSKMKTAINSGLAVFVSEFSICEASGNGWNDTASANTWMDLLNTYDVSCVAWNLSNKAESSSLLNSGCSKTGNFAFEDFSESGQWYLGTLK